jgi:excinuclease ABC subunit C
MRGVKRELAEMAENNAMEAARAAHIAANKSTSTLVRLAQLLSLETVPVRIEAFDISNNLASNTYAGMVVFEDGKPKKSDYRCFKIKSVQDAPDDYASMREAIQRRIQYITDQSEEDSSSKIPDIIFVDGGKGHVNAVKDIVESANMGISLFGMVKDKFHKTRILTDGENEISIAAEQAVFSFIYTIQEEVHRFTLSKMDASRRKSVKTTSLESVSGIGKAKSKFLLSHFKSLQNLKNASVEELCKVKGINVPLANAIYEHFHKTEENK